MGPSSNRTGEKSQRETLTEEGPCEDSGGEATQRRGAEMARGSCKAKEPLERPENGRGKAGSFPGGFRASLTLPAP